MDPNFKFELKPFDIPIVSFAVLKDDYPPLIAPRGTGTCLKGDTFYLVGGFNTFSPEQIMNFITLHGGTISSEIEPSLIYVIGGNPDSDLMKMINGYKQITHKGLFERINASLVKQTD